MTIAPQVPVVAPTVGANTVTAYLPPTDPAHCTRKDYVDSLVSGAGASGPAGGDLTGTYPNPTLAIDRVRKSGDTMTGELVINGGGGNTLALLGGATSDHVYLEFYPRSALPNLRYGHIGYGSAGALDLTVSNAGNALGQGHLYLMCGTDSANEIRMRNGNLEVHSLGVRIGKVWDGGYWGIQSRFVQPITAGAGNSATILLGTTGNTTNHVHVIAGASGYVYLRPDGDATKELMVSASGVTVKTAITQTSDSTRPLVFDGLTGGATYYPVVFKDGAGTEDGMIWHNPSTAKVGIYAGSMSSSTAGVFLLARDEFVSADIYRATATSGVTAVHVNSSGQLFRYTSSVKVKHDIVALDEQPIAEVPYDRTPKGKTVEIPDASQVLNVQPVAYTPDSTKEGFQRRVGVIAENVATHCPWAMTDDGESPDWNQITASLLHVVREQQATIDSLKARVETLETMAW